MQITSLQREVLLALHRHPSGRPFREDAEMKVLDELCRMVPPLVCDPSPMGDSLFTRITDEGRDVLLSDPVSVERMSDRELRNS
jgi:hypothetical protein